MRLVVGLFVAVVHGFLAPTSNFVVNLQLAQQTKDLKVVFFDFDKTLAVGSFGDEYLDRCDPQCMDYTPDFACMCNVTTEYFGDDFVAKWAVQALDEGPGNASTTTEGGFGINGTDRRDRLNQTFTVLRDNGVLVKVLSTSWVWIDASAWAYFLSKVFEAAGLADFLSIDNIVTLDDPGDGIPADKGARAKSFLDMNGWTENEGLLVDDSPGNIGTATGKIGWLQVIPRTGVAEDALIWVETRAAQRFTPAPTTGAPNTPQPTTGAPTTSAPNTPMPTTAAPNSPAPTTAAPNTPAPTTLAPGTTAPTTKAPTTGAPTTKAPGNTVNSGVGLGPCLYTCVSLLAVFFQ